jgi:hypothetical protein
MANFSMDRTAMIYKKFPFTIIEKAFIAVSCVINTYFYEWSPTFIEQGGMSAKGIIL